MGQRELESRFPVVPPGVSRPQRPSRATGRPLGRNPQKIKVTKARDTMSQLTTHRLVRKSLDSPEEDRPFEENSGHLELVNLDSGAVGRATFKPGWRWSTHVKPIAGTDSCQAPHLGYFISGRMTVEMDSGERMDYAARRAISRPWPLATTRGLSVTNPACSSTGRASPGMRNGADALRSNRSARYST